MERAQGCPRAALCSPTPGRLLRGEGRRTGQGARLGWMPSSCCHGPGEDGARHSPGSSTWQACPTRAPAASGAALCMDKLAFGSVVAAAGLPTLPRKLVAPGAEAPQWDGPHIVKPRFGGSSIGIEVIAEWADVTRYAELAALIRLEARRRAVPFRRLRRQRGGPRLPGIRPVALRPPAFRRLARARSFRTTTSTSGATPCESGELPAQLDAGPETGCGRPGRRGSGRRPRCVAHRLPRHRGGSSASMVGERGQHHPGLARQVLVGWRRSRGVPNPPGRHDRRGQAAAERPMAMGADGSAWCLGCLIATAPAAEPPESQARRKHRGATMGYPGKVPQSRRTGVDRRPSTSSTFAGPIFAVAVAVVGSVVALGESAALG